jgi:putative DNA primase/helicase
VNIFERTAPAYYAKGMPVIPLYSREKRPIPMDWSQYHDQPVDEATQANWLQSCSDGNIGIVLGQQSGLCMMDIDSEDPAIINLLLQLLPPSPWSRVGAKGMVLAYRFSGLRTFRIKSPKHGTICELLSTRTQVVLPPSIHPTTQLPYQSNVDLLEVLDQLPVLNSQIESVLRGALKDMGVELSLSGSSRVTDFVSAGARDSSMTSKAGLFAYAVMRGERTLAEAMGMLRSYNSEFVEAVAGDAMDVEKHVQNLCKFIARDVLDKNKQLPVGWDEGLTEKEKLDLGLDFGRDHEEWTFDELRRFIRDEFERNPVDSLGRSNAVEMALARVARQGNLTAVEEGRILSYIQDTSGMGIKVPLLRKRVAELRQKGIAGTDHSEIARAVLSDLEAQASVRRHGGHIWQWAGSHWEVIEPEALLARISSDYGSLPAAKRNSDHKGILSTLMNIVPQGLRTRDARGVNFANGFVDQGLVLRPHDDGFGMTYTLPFRYLPDQLGNSPHFFQFLQDCWGEDADFEDKKLALQEALCVTLFGLGPQFQRAILLKGVAKSGKSQLLKIASSLVPDGARSFVAPNDWADKFLPSQMHEKLINICGELSEKKKIDGMKFKDIIDGAEMSGQLKGQQIFKFRPLCTHWFASNHSPKTEDTSEGFNRRWLVLEFNHPVPPEKRRIDVADLIVGDEREAIVAWAVAAMDRLLVRHEYTLPASHSQVVREMAQENNSVRFFMEESRTVRVSRDSISARTSETKLYKEYWSFCFGPGGARPVGMKQFRSAMRDMQASIGFEMQIEMTPMGAQDVNYKYLTIVGEGAPSK